MEAGGGGEGQGAGGAARQVAVEALGAAGEGVGGGAEGGQVADAADRVVGAVEEAVLAEVLARTLDQLFLCAAVVPGGGGVGERKKEGKNYS